MTNRESAWMAVSFFCAAYVFVGYAIAGMAIAYSNNWLLITLSLVGYVFNLWLLNHANKQW